MFSWVDVESLGVAWAMLVRASVLVAHLVIKGAHLLSPIFWHCVLILIVKSPNWSIRGLKTTSSFLFELSLQRQAFSLEQTVFLRERRNSFFIYRGWLMCRWKVDYFVKIGWSLFPRCQQHSHKDSDDEEGQDSSNHSSSHCYG